MQHAGRRTALREGWRAAELRPVEKDAINGPLMAGCLAVIPAWVGEKDLALRKTRSRSALPRFAQLWRSEAFASLGPAPRRRSLRGARRFAAAEIVSPAARDLGTAPLLARRRKKSNFSRNPASNLGLYLVEQESALSRHQSCEKYHST